MGKIQILLVAALATIAIAEPAPKPMPKGVARDICKYIVGEIDKQLMDGATLDQIIQALEQICGPLDSIIPGATAACETLIETQLPQIIDQLVHNQLSPDAVCVFLTSTISVSAIKTITIPMTVTMTISSITIVCVRGCFSLWLSNDSRKKGEGENGDFHHFDYELFEQNPHK